MRPLTLFHIYIPHVEKAKDADWDALRILGEWVVRRVLQLELGARPDGKPPAWGRELVMACARRNARMVAGWQAYGFMVSECFCGTCLQLSLGQHGVMNTDSRHDGHRPFCSI